MGHLPEPSTLAKHESPLDPSLYGDAAGLFGLGGFIFLAFFLLHEVTAAKMQARGIDKLSLSL